MKSLLNIAFLAIVLAVAGCDVNINSNAKEETKLTIYKKVVLLGNNPHLTILAKKVTLDYDKRVIAVEELKNIIGGADDRDGWIISEMNIQDNILFILMSDDVAYDVYIGERYYYLSALR